MHPGSGKDYWKPGVKLKKGYNGRSTNIWEHRWIPESPSGKPTTPRPNNCDFETVQQLINHRRWNRNTIFRLFNQTDAERILNIPINLSDREDFNYWQLSAGGNYTVSFGYKWPMGESSTRKENREAARTNFEEGSQQSKQIWSTLRKLNIKHKIKVFIWKCINGALPVREALISSLEDLYFHMFPNPTNFPNLLKTIKTSSTSQDSQVKAKSHVIRSRMPNSKMCSNVDRLTQPVECNPTHFK